VGALEHDLFHLYIECAIIANEDFSKLTTFSNIPSLFLSNTFLVIGGVLEHDLFHLYFEVCSHRK
jgi:hypothetical protein